MPCYLGSHGREMQGTLIRSYIELSLTVPITNSLAFLFTVLGEWWAEGKVISRGKPCQAARLVVLCWRVCEHNERSFGTHAPSRDMDRHGIRTGRHCAVRACEELVDAAGDHVPDTMYKQPGNM